MSVFLIIADWMTTVAMLMGLVLCLWAFMRSHKLGYIVIAIYFTLMLVKILVMPSINRKLMDRYPELQQHEQTVAAIDDVIQDHQEYLHGHVEVGRIVEIEFTPLLLVLGLWLVARKDLRNT